GGRVAGDHPLVGEQVGQPPHRRARPERGDGQRHGLEEPAPDDEDDERQRGHEDGAEHRQAGERLGEPVRHPLVDLDEVLLRPADGGAQQRGDQHADADEQERHEEADDVGLGADPAAGCDRHEDPGHHADVVARRPGRDRSCALHRAPSSHGARAAPMTATWEPLLSPGTALTDARMFGEPNTDVSTAADPRPGMTTVAGAPPARPDSGTAPARPAGRPRRTLLASGWSRAGGLFLAVADLAVVAVCSIAFGSKPIPFGTVWDALWHNDGSNDHLIVRDLRVPRTLLGLGVGAALGLAGAIMQGVTRNPLADPGSLGVAAGAALAVVLAIHAFSVTTLGGYVWFAFGGAAL